MTPPIALDSGNLLTFSSRYDIENSWDKGEVQITIDGGANWTRVEVGYPGTSINASDSCGLPIGDYFTGSAPEWARFVADLSPWDGETVMIRWLMSSDGSVTRTLGWNIDDITVGHAPDTCVTTSACADNPIVDVVPDGPLEECLISIPQLNANLSGGLAPFTFQWYRDGLAIAGATAATYQPTDTGVHSYNVRVQAATCPDEISDGQATRIDVESAPQFSGLVFAATVSGATCAIDLDWNAAASVCPGPLVYDVYRSTAPGVAPIAGNRIASAVVMTHFADTLGLVDGQPYHYLVRAMESSTGRVLRRRWGFRSGPACDDGSVVRRDRRWQHRTQRLCHRRVRSQHLCRSHDAPVRRHVQHAVVLVECRNRGQLRQGRGPDFRRWRR